ncbi:Hypothetical predicted protein [Mytilus galloprovincialis]|uniref:Uncharacterized protein n=1 Tax=Mytilus galloprovincialis TaxID=29158 RepID=A0A8B6GR24_MYTGA|nr:Hypothetical predicted protein [Mytilus galloprovincialis]
MTNRTNGVTVTASEHYEGVNIQGLITNAVFGVFGVAISIMLVRVLYGVIKRRVRGCRTGSEYRRGSALSVHNGPPPTYSLLSIKTIPPTYSQACMIIGYHPSIGNITQSETSRNGSFLNVEYSNESFGVDFTATPSSNGDI